MAEPRKLANPPIAEAIVDVRIVAEHPIDSQRLVPLRDELREEFPKIDERRQIQGEFRFEAGKLLPPTVRDTGLHGLWLRSADDARLVQLRSDGFTFNNVGLGSYMGGDALLQEALRLWSRYAAVAAPTAAIRVALRYINRLSLPLVHGDEFTKFLASPPELPEGAPQNISNFLYRVVAHDEMGATAIVSQKLDGGPPGAPVPVIIDLDVFFSQEMAPTSDGLRPYLERLRDLKNRTFFALLTEEAVKLYI
jgi:uncharacterized protein (TIGR04255 family)